MRALLAIALLTTLAFAGCSDGGGGGDGDEGGSGTVSGSASGTRSASSTGSATASSSPTTTGAPPANRPPVGSLAAAVNGTAVTFALAGSDPDGDALSWTLSFGDGSAAQGGSELPANVTHTYAVGNHTAMYNITDGKATAMYNVSVGVAAAGGVALTFSGDVSSYCAFCTEVLGEQDGTEAASPFPSVGWASGEQGIDTIWVEIPAALIGHAWTATTTGADIAIAAFSACSPDGHFIEMVDTGAIPETGIVPAGTGCMVLWEYLSWVPPPLGAPSDPAKGEQTLGLVVS